MNKTEFPIPFIKALQEMLGAEADELLRALQQPPPVSIRYNETKFPVLATNQVPWCVSGEYLEQRPIFTLDPKLHAGAYYVQEASSMFLAQLALIISNLGDAVRALDLCAAPGGKSTLLANLLPQNSLLVCNEVIRSRASILQENITKWGFPNTVITNNDPQKFAALPGFFDLILIDAPCSGEGMFRKDKAAINEWSPQNVQLCAERQRRIVADAWNALRKDGILIYSTCTFNRLENEENVQWIIDDLGAEEITIPIDSAWGIVESDNGYRFYPHRVCGEGFFVSVLRKKSDTARFPILKKEIIPSQTPFLSIQNWLSGDFIFEEKNNIINAFPAAQYNAMSSLSKQLNVLQAGVAIGERKGKDLVPSAALALSEAFRRDYFFEVEVDLPTALKYLRRENVHFPDAPDGFLLICYENLPLGFAKKIGKRTNNLFPLSWRIRMQINAE